MLEKNHLIKLIDAYSKAADVDDTRLSFWVFGDSKKITALRGGADITVTRFNKAISWFSKNWPTGTKWPKELNRPESA